LPISVESSGIPTRALAVADNAEVGVDDEAMSAAPEPHIPEEPAVTAIPEEDNAEVADIPDDIVAWAAGAADAVAGGEIPFNAMPPPS
jgi:hypothetical protein